MLMCISIETPKTINFPLVPNGKLMVLGFPIFKHIRVLPQCCKHLDTLTIQLFP